MIVLSRFQLLQDELVEWSDATFGSGDRLVPILKHLQSEIGELVDTPMDRMEYADCFILLIEAAGKVGLSMDDLVDAAYEKHEINKNRVWGKPNKDGYVEHIED